MQTQIQKQPPTQQSEHSSMPPPTPLKYPPPPTIPVHSNQPPPQLQQSGAWETLRSAVSLKPHAGWLLASLWFSFACSPSPLQSGLPYKTLSEFTHFCIMTFLWFCLYSVLFSRLHFMLLISLFLSCVGLWPFGKLDPAAGNLPFSVLRR